MFERDSWKFTVIGDGYVYEVDLNVSRCLLD